MDLYERLGVRRSAGGAEIRRAWQRLSRALHPAVNPGDPVAAERYREAARAFEILADPLRRSAYDCGELVVDPVEPRAEAGFEGFDFEARVRVESVGFRDIFEAAAPAAAGAARRGPGAGDARELRGVDAGRQAPRAPRALRGLRGLPRRGRGGLRPGAVSALRRHGQRARQPGPHDLLAPLPGLRRPRRDEPQAVPALQRRGPRAHERVAGGAHPGGRRQRHEGAPARRRQRRPARRAARRLRAHGRGGAASGVPARGRRPLLQRARRHGAGGDGRARGGGDARRHRDDRGAGRNPERTALQAAQARRAAARGRRTRRPVGRGAGRDPGGHGRPRPLAAARAVCRSCRRARAHATRTSHEHCPRASRARAATT